MLFVYVIHYKRLIYNNIFTLLIDNFILPSNIVTEKSISKNTDSVIYKNQLELPDLFIILYI